MGTITKAQRVTQIGDFIGSGGFGLFVLGLVFWWTLAMLVFVFWPQNFDQSSAFAASFRIWCFGYDPVTGKFDQAKIIMLILDPIFLGVIVGVVWFHPISEILKKKVMQAARMQIFSIGIVAAILVAVAASQAANLEESASLFDFQLIREFQPAPTFNLTDQNGSAYTLKPGKITIVSAFYTHCTHTCPMIINQMKAALGRAKLSSSDVDVALVTLDPENDTVARLKEREQKLNLESNWHLLTGDSKTINSVLDSYQVARAKAADGTIGHSNIFYVIDKKGNLAFKIGLGSVQEIWLRQAMERLLKEDI